MFPPLMRPKVKMPGKDGDKWMMGPRKERKGGGKAFNQVLACTPQVLPSSDTVFKMTDVKGLNHEGLDTFYFLLLHQPLCLSAQH